MSEAVASLMTEDEFVAFELASAERHELVDGVVRAMTGASIRHNDVALNLAMLLRRAATGTGCRVNIEGVRLRVNSRRHYYPDVMVTCEPADDPYAQSAPCLIAEVLSPTTASIDRGEKRLAYLAMPSLRHLLLIDLEAEAVEHVWRRDAGDAWFFELGGAGGVLHLTCPVEVAIEVDAVLAEP